MKNNNSGQEGSEVAPANLADESPTAPKFIGWRCIHQLEGGHPNPDKMPVVRPSANAPAIPFTEPMQLMSFALNSFNPKFTQGKWRVVYARKTAFTNQNGFMDENDPRADFVNRKDLNRPLPKLMKAIICGGMFLRGEVDGDQLRCIPGIHAIDANKKMPEIEEIMEQNWYFHATTRSGKKINHFPQGMGQPVLIPYILTVPVVYPLEWFERWESGELPDPLKLYHPH